MRNIENIILRLKMATSTKSDLELAEKLGIRSNTISNWRARSTIPFEHIDVIAQETNVPFDWFLEEKTQITPFRRGIPLLKKIPKWWPDIDADDIEEYLKLPNTQDQYWAIYARGEGMFPLVRDNDILVFEIWENFSDGDILIALDPWGDLLVRRYRKQRSEIFLVSENPDYPPQQIDTRYELVGLVRKIWREFRF